MQTLLPELKSLLVIRHQFELHPPVTKSIPLHHIHSQSSNVLIWWYLFSVSYYWCVVTLAPTVETDMIRSFILLLFHLVITRLVESLIYFLASCHYCSVG